MGILKILGQFLSTMNSLWNIGKLDNNIFFFFSFLFLISSFPFISHTARLLEQSLFLIVWTPWSVMDSGIRQELLCSCNTGKVRDIKCVSQFSVKYQLLNTLLYFILMIKEQFHDNKMQPSDIYNFFFFFFLHLTA